MSTYKNIFFWIFLFFYIFDIITYQKNWVCNMNVVIDNEEFIDSEEVASRLKIALSTLKVKVRANEVPLPIKLKTYTFWRLSEIEEYLEKNKR